MARLVMDRQVFVDEGRDALNPDRVGALAPLLYKASLAVTGGIGLFHSDGTIGVLPYSTNVDVLNPDPVGTGLMILGAGLLMLAALFGKRGSGGPMPVYATGGRSPLTQAPINIRLPEGIRGLIEGAKMTRGRDMPSIFLAEGSGDKSMGTVAKLRIEENCPSEEARILHENLLEYERTFCTLEFTEPINHNFLVKDGNNRIIGGVNFHISFGTSYVRDIWVRGDYRGQGIAAELMRRVEDFSRKKGAVYVALDTMEFEAPGFYERIGYKKEHERENVFGKYSQYSFIKKL